MCSSVQQKELSSDRRRQPPLSPELKTCAHAPPALQDAEAEKRLLAEKAEGPRPLLPQSPRKALQPPFSTAVRITSVISQSDVIRLLVWHKVCAENGVALGLMLGGLRVR